MQTISSEESNLLKAYNPVHLHLYISGALIPSELGRFNLTASVGDEETSCGNSVASILQIETVAEQVVRALATQSGYLVNAQTGETIITTFNWSQQYGATAIVPIIATQSGYALTTQTGEVISVQFVWKKLTGTGIRITWDVDGETEHNLFQGRIEKVTIAGGKATITAQDEIFWNGSRPFAKQSNFQSDVVASDVFGVIADTMKVPVNQSTESLLSSVTISGGFSSCRDILPCCQAAGYIAALAGGNAVINRDGELAVVKYYAVDFETEPYSGEASAENVDYVVSGIGFARTYVDKTTNPDGTISESERRVIYQDGDGSLEMENPLADVGAAERAYAALRSFASRKGSFSFPMGIELEPGDLITVHSMDGDYPVAINTIEFSIDGGVRTTVHGGGQLYPNGVNGTVVEEPLLRGNLRGVKSASSARTVGDGSSGTATEVQTTGRPGPITQRLNSLEEEVRRVKNLQAENAEIVSAKIQNLFAEDILCTNKFEVNNDAWELTQNGDGFTLSSKTGADVPDSFFRIGSQYARILTTDDLGQDCGILIDGSSQSIDIRNNTGRITLGDNGWGAYGTSIENPIIYGDLLPTWPATDPSASNIGSTSMRINTIYLANNPNVSSDRNLKQDIYDSVPDIVDNLIPVSYRLKDDPDGRIHYGFIAQDVEEALIANEVDTDQIGLVRFDADRDGSKTNYSLAYDELIPILTEKIKKQQDQIDSLQDRLDRLERMMNNG